jgi:hypothetical protein
VTVVSRADRVTATSPSGSQPGRILGVTAASRSRHHPAGTPVRRIIVTLLATACAVAALSGCGAPVADAAGTASIAIAGR